MKILLIIFRIIFLLITGLFSLIYWPYAILLEWMGFNPSKMVYKFMEIDSKIVKCINRNNLNSDE